jgi:hypothetical protein
MPIALDASTPAVVHQAAGTTGTAATVAFSPPANSLVVISVVWLFNASSPSSLSCKDSLANVYAKGTFLDNVQETSTAIFQFYYSSAPGSITVTVTCSSTALAAVQLVPQVLTGANSSQSGAGAASDNDDGDVGITTTTSGSWVFAAGGAPTDKRPPTPDATLTQLDTYDDTVTTKNQGAVGKVTKVTSAPGHIKTGWTANMAQAVALEILPAAPILLGNGGAPGPVWQTGQVLSASDCNTWLVPLAQQKTAATVRSAQTILVTDPDLQLPFVSTGNWAVFGSIVYDGPSAADFSFTFTVPAGAAFDYLAAYQNTASNFAQESHVAGDVINADTDGTGSPSAILIAGMVLMGSTPGSLSLSWAQQHSNATAVTVYQCSYLTAWRLG